MVQKGISKISLLQLSHFAARKLTYASTVYFFKLEQFRFLRRILITILLLMRRDPESSLTSKESILLFRLLDFLQFWDRSFWQ